MRGLALVGLSAGLALAATALAVEPRTQVAGCDPGPVAIGSGKAGWRRESLSAGPLGVRRRPLRQMSPYSARRPHRLVAKVPLLIEGHEPVTVRVPPRLARRAFLYYGFHRGRDGGRSTSFAGYPGDSTVEFTPCTDRPRTVWPGGVRVRGRPRVTLLVQVGEDEPIALRLGRPTVRR